MIYLSLLPQFIDPAAENVLTQSVTLDLTQIAVSVTVDALIAAAAGPIAAFLAARPFWLPVRRWLMGTGLAERMAFDERRLTSVVGRREKLATA